MKKTCSTLLVSGALIGLLAHPAQAQQTIDDLGLTVTTTVTLGTDYLFRGISQTDTGLAIQGGIDIEHASGLYIGGFASNVDFGDANIETDLVFGYRFAVGGLKLDLGGIWYAYPGADNDLDFFEFAGRASYALDPVTLVGGVYYSPEFQARAGNAWYAEGGADVALPWELTLSGRAGYQWIEKNDRFGLDDFANWSVSVSRTFYGFRFSVGYYDTNVGKGDCPLGVGGSNICEARAMASVSRTF